MHSLCTVILLVAQQVLHEDRVILRFQFIDLLLDGGFFWILAFEWQKSQKPPPA
jgi:hypothetical protein